MVRNQEGFRRFLKTPEADRFVIDRDKVEADARFDGLFVLRTNMTDAAIRGHVFYTFLALVLRTELMARLAARGSGTLEWQRIVDDLADLSEVDVEQDGKRARLRTAPGPTTAAVCLAVGVGLPPVFQEMPAVA